MPSRRNRFTKELEEEAVRLVSTSGRAKREIAADLDIGLGAGDQRHQTGGMRRT